MCKNKTKALSNFVVHLQTTNMDIRKKIVFLKAGQ